MKCQCPIAGYCETHQRKMSAGWHQRCQSDDGYFDAFQADLNKPKSEPKSSGCGGCQKRKEWLNEKTGSLKLGDKVEAVTKATGIKAVVDHFAKDKP